MSIRPPTSKNRWFSPGLELDVAVALAQQLAELEQGFLRQDDADLLRDARLVLHLDQRQAMAVGGHQRQAVRASARTSRR